MGERLNTVKTERYFVYDWGALFCMMVILFTCHAISSKRKKNIHKTHAIIRKELPLRSISYKNTKKVSVTTETCFFHLTFTPCTLFIRRHPQSRLGAWRLHLCITGQSRFNSIDIMQKVYEVQLSQLEPSVPVSAGLVF